MKFIVWFLANVAVFGVAAPALISAADTFLVLGGIALVVAGCFGNYRFALHVINKEFPNA